jgi:hypothetical protein
MSADCILVTASDIVRGSEDEFNRWYNERHVADFVACPGINRASRYESLVGEPRYYAIYDLDGPEAVVTPQVRKVWGWGPVAPFVRNSHGRVYVKTFSLESDVNDRAGDGPADFVLVTSSDVISGQEAAFEEWYNETHVPEILACPGFLSAARYRCIDGEPMFLALYDLDRPDALETPEMKRVHGWGPMTPYLRDFHARVYRRFFTYEG